MHYYIYNVPISKVIYWTNFKYINITFLERSELWRYFCIKLVHLHFWWFIFYEEWYVNSTLHCYISDNFLWRNIKKSQC